MTDFCLVLTPTMTAAGRAADAIRQRFAFLEEVTSRAVSARVADLVQESVDRRTRRPITVNIALERDSIRGEVADERGLIPFEVSLAVAA